MAKDHRIEGQPFTCRNTAYQTDTTKGEQHGKFEARGSVFKTPLVSSGYTLWLEHVIGIRDGSEFFWLMWYDDDGMPTIPLSGVMSIKEVRSMSSQLALTIDPNQTNS